MKARKYKMIVLLFLIGLQIISAPLMVTPILATSEIDRKDNNQNNINDMIIDKDQYAGPEINDFYPENIDQLGPLTTNVETDVKKSVNYEENPLTINIDLEKSVISPDEDLLYSITTVAGNDPVDKTVKITIIEGEYWSYYYFWYDENYDIENRTIEEFTINTGSDGEYIGTFSTGSEGKFTIIAEDPQESSYYWRTSHRTFSVTKIGIFWRAPMYYMEDQSYLSTVAIVNTTTFEPIEGASITLEAIKNEYVIDEYIKTATTVFTGTSNSEGFANVEFIPTSGITTTYGFLANLTVEYEGSTLTLMRDVWKSGGWSYWRMDDNVQPYEFVMTTDKSVYQPGETVQSRILIWEVDYLSVTRTPVSTEFTLTFESPDNHILFQRTVTTNEFGIVSVDLPLDTDAKIGDYSLKATKGTATDYITIPIMKYEKPAFRVTVNLDNEYVPLGSTVSGNISAEYYFGKPVVDGDVKIQIGDIKTLTGSTDAEGFMEYSYRLPSTLSEEIYTLNVTASVIDTVDREVQVTKEVQVAEDIYVWSYVSPWNPQINENISIYFYGYQFGDPYGWYYYYRWLPLANAPVTINIYGYEDDGTDFTLLTTLKSETNEFGYGNVIFELSQENIKSFFKFKVEVAFTPGDGRSESTETYFMIQRYYMDVEQDQAVYMPGEELEFNLTLKDVLTDDVVKGNIQIYAYDPDYDRVCNFIQAIDQKELIKIPTFSLSTYGTYRVDLRMEVSYTYGDGYEYKYFRYFKSIYFSVGDDWELTIDSDKTSYSLQDTMTISVDIVGETNLPVIVQFVKRGIVHTEYVDLPVSNSFEVAMDNLGYLAPTVRVYVFAILTNGIILEDYLELEIDTTIDLSILTDKEIYEPGEELTVTISAEDGNAEKLPIVLAVSFIDSSVFGVVEDPENENQHFEDDDYWPLVFTSVSWKNNQPIWWIWCDYEGYGYGYRNIEYYGDYAEEQAIDAPAGGQKTNDRNTESSSSDKREIRDNLPENAFWNPLIILESGQLGGYKYTLTLPDTIGEWTIRVVGTTETGQGTLSKETIKTFIPFFVDIDKEPFVLQDDIFVIKGIVYNYLDDLVDISLELESDTGLTILGDPNQTMRLPSGFIGAIGWACLAENPSNGINVTLYASGVSSEENEIYYDAIRKSIEVIPNGITKYDPISGFISQDDEFTYYRYDETVKQTEFLELSLGIGSISLNSWDRLVGYPYGCIEQTLSKLLPDVLIYEYLKTTDQLTNETEERLFDMIMSGLSRIKGMQHYNGGWGWWYNDVSNIYMTSIVLYGLSVVNNSGIYVNPFMVESGIEFLTNRQNADGSWDVSLYRRIDEVAFTAFVSRALISWNTVYPKTTVINKALTYVQNQWNSLEKQSSYLAALVLGSTIGTDFEDASFNSELITYILSNEHYYRNNPYWTYEDEGYWWRPLGGTVEVTALVVEALILDDLAGHMKTLRGAANWLLGRQRYYGWGSTADTSAAISAIIKLSSQVISDEDVVVSIFANSNPIGTYDLSTSNISSVYINMKDYFKTGENTIHFEKTGDGNVSYLFEGNQVLRELPTVVIPKSVSANPSSEFTIDVIMQAPSSNVAYSEIIVTPLSGSIIPLSLTSQTLDYLTGIHTFEFTYLAPSPTGQYIIPGFNVQYRLIDPINFEKSPGIVSRQFTDIDLVVSNSNIYIDLDKRIVQDTSIELKTAFELKQEELPGIDIAKSFSKTTGFIKGDITKIVIELSNSDDTEFFIMVEETIPVGFIIDETSISISTGTYSKTTKGISFFIPEIGEENIDISYSLIAVDVRQSIVEPTRISSMYDDWIIQSEPEILGDLRLPVSIKTGNFALDYEDPTINSFEFTPILINDKPVVKTTLSIQDNWGVASVKIYTKQDLWKVTEAEEISTNQWESYTSNLRDGFTEVYFEVIDITGNVLIYKGQDQYFEISDLDIPFITIFGLLTIASLIGVASLLIAKKYQG